MSYRSMWKGAIQLGLMTIPVKLYNATDDSVNVSFNMLCGKDGGTCQQKIKMPTVCPVHGEILRAETVKGYEYTKGSWVVVDEAELTKIALETVRVMVIDRFVPSVGSFPKQTYYMAPDKVGAKAFGLLREVLAETGRIAIGKVMVRQRETMAALMPYGWGLVLQTLYWPDEIRDINELELPGMPTLTPAEKAMAKTLVDSMSGDFDPTLYEDKYRTAVIELIQSKLDGTAPAAGEPAPVATEPIDIMAMLAASVASMKKEEPAEEPKPKRRGKSA